MFKRTDTPEFDPSWAVPRGSYHASFPRASKYCVVIPVINEGSKISSQLGRMVEAGISSVADIIIADGGSTDGSLGFDMLESMSVRTLIVKDDAGKLGAQLRMGYAYAMAEGYEGVVTVDGNDKDSVESIPLFIEALDAGADYAQGSRYMRGGRAVNTPLVRYIASRFIHTTLVSIAAQRRMTDTTNGFRAYSRRYLLHPGVRPFRDVFMTYELLAYLSARASRLGLKVVDVPVTRTYPDKGPMPTKISFFGGNMLLMKILFRLLAGEYDPPSGGDSGS